MPGREAVTPPPFLCCSKYWRGKGIAAALSNAGGIYLITKARMRRGFSHLWAQSPLYIFYKL
jgi:hypothetical protein